MGLLELLRVPVTELIRREYTSHQIHIFLALARRVTHRL